MGVLDEAIEFFRRQRTSLFRAECVVTRTTFAGTFDPETGTIGVPTKSFVYDGACNIREATWEGDDVRTGEREVRLQRSVLTFPFDTLVREDDVLVVTAAPNDTALVGTTYRITDVSLDAWQTVRRAIGEKIARGPEEDES